MFKNLPSIFHQKKKVFIHYKDQ